MLKFPRVTFRFKGKNDFLKEILNIEYQSGGYSIFNIEYRIFNIEYQISNITLTSVWFTLDTS